MTQERVLIVEDEENERTGLAELVSGWGYRTDTAADGVEALEKIPLFGPSIVITDVKMPRMGGMELVERLAECKRHKSPRGSELVFLKTPGSEELIEITCFPGSGPVQVQPDLTHLAFEVDSLAKFEKHLASHGLKFSDGPMTSSSGTTFAFIDAPEGYEIELIEQK